MMMMILLLILLSPFLSDSASSSPSIISNETVSFTFISFNSESCSDGYLICTGDVTPNKGYLSLTSEPFPGSPSLPIDKVGRVLFSQPVLAWPASITSIFTIRILKYSNSTTDSGDGMTFIFAPNANPSPPSSYGSNLGFIDSSPYGENNQQLAVELDTYKNDFDLDGNHVGVDTTSVSLPVAAKSLNNTGVDLKSGRQVRVIINYNGSKKVLYVYVHYLGKSPKKVLEQSINISDIVPSSVFVGFTAATGAFSESHQLLNWSFTSEPLKS